MPEQSFSGNDGSAPVAIVTGASRNIGRAIAIELGRLGASVVVHARDRVGAEETARLVREAGGETLVFLGDLLEPETAPQLVQAAVSAFGRLDIVVANAAIRPEGAIETISHEDWRSVMGVTLDSAFLLVKAALQELRNSRRGAVITIGGLTAHTGAANRLHVVTAKAGLVGLTKALAHELGPSGITVNCVSPGLIETERDGHAPLHHHKRSTVLGHYGTPNDVAAMVGQLAGERSRFITGQVFHVNGGAFMA
ncbi:SDR family NAD(P)-dependent oxidoreductase [Pseudochelatococcus sp. B33]